MGRAVDVIPIGNTFGRLTILKEVEPRNMARYVHVACSCGARLHVRWQNVKHGLTQSCWSNNNPCSAPTSP